MYIFLDESGNFTKHDHEQYFLIGSFTIGEPRKSDKAIRSWFGSKFPRKMRTQNEIKWSSSGIDDRLRLKTLKRIADINVRIRYGYLLRVNIPDTYRKKGKIESGLLYTKIVGDVLKRYMSTNEKEVHVFCDRRSLKGMSKRQFEMVIQKELSPLCSPDTRIQVEMVDSASNGNMQIADWISGALSRYLENGALGAECYGILKNNFLDDGLEFFPNKK